MTPPENLGKLIKFGATASVSRGLLVETSGRQASRWIRFSLFDLMHSSRIRPRQHNFIKEAIAFLPARA